MTVPLSIIFIYMKPLTVLLITVGVGAIAFFGGMKYQESVSLSRRQMMFGGDGMRTIGAQSGNTQQTRMGVRPISGELVSIDEDSVTVKTPDGGSKIVLFTDKMTIHKASVAEKADMKTGEKVMIIGTGNADGSVSAQSIQLNPSLYQNRVEK